jgi:CRP/FNR family cyclic AMP-dependent transcriptional regulator
MHKINCYNHPIFRELNEIEKQKVLKIFKKREIKKDEIVVKEDEVGDSAFLLVEGKVQVLKKSIYNEAYVVTIIEAGGKEFFGEINLIDGGKRTSTIKTIEDSVILEITRDEFKKFMDKNPITGYKIMWQMTQSCAKHLRKADEDIITLFNALVEVVENE